MMKNVRFVKLSKKFFEINGEAKENIQKFSKDVALQLEKTKYEVILNHKQMITVVSWLENNSPLDDSHFEKELLDVFREAKEI